MKTYPQYKPSGIDWLGEIPEHWQKLRFKYFLDQITSPSTAIRKVALENIESQTGRYIETNSEFEGDGVGFILGDIVYGKLRPYLKKVWLAEFDGNAIGDFFVYRAKENANNNYIKWLFLTEDFTSIVNQSTNGAKMPRVSSDFIKDLDFFLPPIEEQEAIAAYLDDVTGKIDKLIAEKQKQVEDLRSYRTSLITETVTRGLNPNAPLRPSGIDWLGDIPEHWKTTKLKYVSTVQTGSTPSTSVEKYWDNPIRDWFTPGDFNTFRLSSSNRKVSEVAFNEGACRIFPKNSILLVGIGATLGKVGITTVECSANQQVNAIAFNNKVYPLFGAYYLSSCNNALNSVSNASTLAILNQEQTKQFPMVVPPISEQKSIAEFLDEKTEKIDALINELDKQLNELDEYKKAVISEAVTGKVDVRDWKPQN
ncbi:MAG: hypothetical protein HDS42_05345 [Bacteroides sp.]|nr:hypothetical protein [Bacteroides sp.]